MVATRGKEAAVIFGIVWGSLYLYDEVKLQDVHEPLGNAVLSSMFALVLIRKHQEDIRKKKSITEHNVFSI